MQHEAVVVKEKEDEFYIGWLKLLLKKFSPWMFLYWLVYCITQIQSSIGHERVRLFVGKANEQANKTKLKHRRIQKLQISINAIFKISHEVEVRQMTWTRLFILWSAFKCISVSLSLSFCLYLCVLFAEGKDREAEAKQVMKQLEKKYAALKVVSVIEKLGNPTVREKPQQSHT